MPRRNRDFNLFPDGGFLFIRVRVHKNKRVMRYALRHRHPGRCEAVCCGGDAYVKKDGHYWFSGKFAEVHLHSDYFGIGVISHELCHATHEYFRSLRHHRLGHVISRKVDPRMASQQEEAFCWVLGNLVRQFCRKLMITMLHLNTCLPNRGQRRYDSVRLPPADDL
jgi:hypothetical protein